MNLTVTAGPHGYKNCPLSAPLEISDLALGEASLVDAAGNRIACQLYVDGGKTAIAWIEKNMKPGEVKTYRFETAPAGVGNVVEVEDIGDGKLEVRIGGKLFTRYYYDSKWVRPFLYPFIGPDELPVTRSYPIKLNEPGETDDHPHHKSVWIAHGDVNGTDNWSEEPGHAFQRHQKFLEVTGGPIFGRIRSLNSWVSSDGSKQMEDVRDLTFYALGDERLVDVSVKFIASDGDVLLGDTKEGGVISVRVATSMDGDKGGMMVNAYGGKTEAENWGKPSHWVDYYGPVGGETLGIAIMDHPLSFRYPTRWHVRDYGLFTANPFALKYYEPDRGWNGDHTIKNGDTLAFKYRLYVHKGDTETAGVREKYFGFIAPPKVAES